MLRRVCQLRLLYQSLWECVYSRQQSFLIYVVLYMESFMQWCMQINAKYTDTLIVLISAFLKLALTILPQKDAEIDYEIDQPETEPVSLEKVIIAVEFDKILIEHSRYFRKDMIRLNVPVQRTWFEKLMFWREVGYFYKRRSGYDQFLKTLSKIPNVLLYIYTRESHEIADRLVEQLRLTHYFPQPYRRYNSACKVFGNTKLKHPAYVDTFTGRVIILTADLNTDCDDSNESSRYFVEIPYDVDANKLQNYATLLANVIHSNKKREDLHEEIQNKMLSWKYHGKL